MILLVLVRGISKPPKPENVGPGFCPQGPQMAVHHGTSNSSARDLKWQRGGTFNDSAKDLERQRHCELTVLLKEWCWNLRYFLLSTKQQQMLYHRSAFTVVLLPFKVFCVVIRGPLRCYSRSHVELPFEGPGEKIKDKISQV